MRSGSSVILALSIYASLLRTARTAARPLPDQSLNRRDGETTAIPIQTWPGKPYVSFVGREDEILDIASCGHTALSQTQLHWTTDGVDSPDTRAKCQTALLVPVPSTDPNDGIFAIAIADSALGSYRAWQAGAEGETTLFEEGDDKYRGKACQIANALDGRCLFRRQAGPEAPGQGTVEWATCISSNADQSSRFDLRRQDQDFSQGDHTFAYLP